MRDMKGYNSMYAVQMGWEAPAHKLPEFDRGKDGFPRPGQVIRYFRQRKQTPDGKTWTQHDLALALGKQELAIREMELRDIGLNDISHLRFLAGLLAIPPQLLGLATIPEVDRANTGSVTWWVQLGVPAFDAGPDGFPRPGQVVKYFRLAKCKADGQPWTQHDLALALGKQELAISEMERKDIGLNDISRRRFLSRMLSIPPILLGLAPFSQQPVKKRWGEKALIPRIVLPSGQVDIEEIREALTSFWSQNRGAPAVLTALDSTLRRLYERYPTATSQDRIEIVSALCELHIHSANLLRDRRKFSKALEHLNKASSLNTLLQEEELQADILYRRGGLYLENGEHPLALSDYRAAEKKLPCVSPPLQAAILLETALAEAGASPLARHTALLKKLDKAGHLIRTEHTERGREQRPYLRVDIGRYHLDRAATLITLGYAGEAQRELLLLKASDLTGRRSVYSLILQAQTYLGLKEYPQAAIMAEQALPLVRQVRSHVNLERIKKLYTQLLQSPFQGNPEVEHLGYLISHS